MICRGCEWWGPRVARHSSHRSQAEQCLGSRLRLACQPAPHAAASRPPPTPEAGSATARHSYCQKKRARSPCAPRLQFPDYSEAGPIAACRNPRKLPQIPSRQCENQQGPGALRRRRLLGKRTGPFRKGASTESSHRRCASNRECLAFRRNAEGLGERPNPNGTIQRRAQAWQTVALSALGYRMQRVLTAHSNAYAALDRPEGSRSLHTGFVVS